MLSSSEVIGHELGHLSLFGSSVFSFFFVHLLLAQFLIHSFLSHVPSLSLLLFLHPSLPPSYPAASTLLPLSSLSSRGGGYG